MILGVTTLTFVQVIISLIGILSGLVVVFGILGSKWLSGWNMVFLVTTVLTSVTGFFFPFHARTRRPVFDRAAGGHRGTVCVTVLQRVRAGGAVIHQG